MKTKLFSLLLAALLAVSYACAAPFDDALARFNSHVTAATANQFFRQLLTEDFLDEPMQFADDTPADTLRAQVWYWAGEYLNDTQHYAEATQWLLKALPLFEHGTNRQSEADCLNLLAIVSVRQADYDNAARYALRCYQLDEASGDADRTSSSLNTLAGIYMGGGQPQEAEQYILKAIDMARRADNPARMAVLQGMASEVYHALGNDSKALAHAEEAYRLDHEGGREDRATVRQAQKAAALLGLQRWAEAEQILTSVIAYFRQQGEQHSLGLALNDMGKALLGQQRQPEAVVYYREAAALFARMGDQANELHARRGLYESLWQSDPDAAKAELDRFNLLRDSIYNHVSADRLARYNAEFGNDWLQLDNHAQRRAKWWAIALAALAALVAAAVWWVMRRRHRRQQQVNDQLSTDISELRKQYRELNMRYDNALATRPTAEQPQLNAADRDFMERLVSTTNTLISDGQVDAASVAAQLGMSLFQLRQRLAVLTGDTPQTFIQNIRMRRARHLLDNHHELNITEVARLCAYSDTPNFTRAFKKAFGVTPTQYKPSTAASPARNAD